MQILATKFPEAKIVIPDVFHDERGYFKEIFSEQRYAESGMPGPFLQDNVSVSRRNVIRGMHFDLRMAKLVQVIEGRIYDVIADMREGSPTFRQWDGIELSDENHRQLYVPPGFAHGFLTLSERAVVLYKQTAFYDPATERAVSWRDPALGIRWPLDGSEPVLSQKDAAL